jgi:hypothetical protein
MYQVLGPIAFDALDEGVILVNQACEDARKFTDSSNKNRQLATNATSRSNRDRQYAANARLYAGLVLVELRRRVEAGEAGEVTWWAWYKEHFTRSRKDAEKLLKLAGAEDPEAAAEAARAKNADEAKKSRDKKKDAADISGSTATIDGVPDSLLVANLAAKVNSLPDELLAEFFAKFDAVGLAMHLVSNMDESQRRKFHREYEALISATSPPTAPEAPADAPAAAAGTPAAPSGKRKPKGVLARS